MTALNQRWLQKDELFWAKVDRSGGPDACWPWLGHRNRRGYGMLQRRRVASRPLLAPRYVLFLATGRMPEGLALHSCDNPPCVNPAHLREGTAAENSADAIARGRHVPPPRLVGDQNPRRKLSEALVEEIRRRVADGELHRAIAADLSVARSTVTAINRGQNWAHTQVKRADLVAGGAA